MPGWRDAVVEEAVDNLVPPLTEGMGRAEVTAAREAYRTLLGLSIDAVGRSEPLARELAREQVEEKLGEIAGRSLGERRRLLGEEVFRARVRGIDARVATLASRKLEGASPTDEERVWARRACGELGALGEQLRASHAELHDELAWRISESTVECHYVLEGGSALSLRLGRQQRRLEGAAGRE
jgi:hypothetical protein